MILGHFLLVIMQIVDSQYCLHQREYSQCLCVGAPFSKHFLLIYVYMYKWAYKWAYIIGFDLQSTVFFLCFGIEIVWKPNICMVIAFQVLPKLNATRSMLMIFNSIRASTFILINTCDDFRSSRLWLFCDVDDFYRQFAWLPYFFWTRINWNETWKTFHLSHYFETRFDLPKSKIYAEYS